MLTQIRAYHSYHKVDMGIGTNVGVLTFLALICLINRQLRATFSRTYKNDYVQLRSSIRALSSLSKRYIFEDKNQPVVQ